MKDNMEKFDIAVIGGGPAGYTAAMYASRAGRRTAVFEKGSPGGQMGVTSVIENYPGFESVDGFDLAMKMQAHAKKFGAVMKNAEVVSASLVGERKIIRTERDEIEARAVIIATGARPRLLGVPGEKEHIGRGVSYCATCDGMFFKGKTVVVNGGGNTAIEDALYLSNVCDKVIVVHRRDKFRAARYEILKAESRENIEFMLNTVTEEIIGEGKSVVGVRLRHTDGSKQIVDCSGVFIAVGRVPETEIFLGQVETDASGYIVASEDCRSSLGGVFAAGDVRTKRLRQIVTAVADGAMAAQSAEEWLG